MALVGLGLIGCTPSVISAFGTNGSACVDIMNIAAQQFNQRLVALVDQLNSNFTNAKFIYINSFEMGSGDPAAAGTCLRLLMLSNYEYELHLSFKCPLI